MICRYILIQYHWKCELLYLDLIYSMLFKKSTALLTYEKD